VATMEQYQMEERSLIANRIKASIRRVQNLFVVMNVDRVSSDEKVVLLKRDLARHHKTKAFNACTTMGQIVYENLRLVVDKDFRASSQTFDGIR
ncbi:MAG: hypothetical protein AAGJ82_08530, partial [Bacteroidota bacterium]